MQGSELTENVVTLWGSVCSRPCSCGLVVPVAAGAAALAVLLGTLMLKAVGIIVGAGGNAGADVSSSNRLCMGMADSEHLLLLKCRSHTWRKAMLTPLPVD